MNGSSYRKKCFHTRLNFYNFLRKKVLSRFQSLHDAKTTLKKNLGTIQLCFSFISESSSIRLALILSFSYFQIPQTTLRRSSEKHVERSKARSFPRFHAPFPRRCLFSKGRSKSVGFSADSPAETTGGDYYVARDTYE